MHLFIGTRGISQNFEMWKKFMETQMFWFRQKPILKDDKGNFLKNPDGTYQYGPEGMVKVQGALRPIQFFEYVFPQESLQEVLAMMNCQSYYKNLRPEMQPIAWTMRKLLHAKKIPDMGEEFSKKERWQITDKFVPMDGMAVYPIGIKEDITQDFIFTDGKGGEVGFNQEGL